MVIVCAIIGELGGLGLEYQGALGGETGSLMNTGGVERLVTLIGAAHIVGGAELDLLA